MDITSFTYKTIAQKRIGWRDSKIFVDWAVTLMQNGFNSNNLQILAGLDISDTEEREHYFWKAVNELNLSIDKKETEQLEFFVEHLVQETLEGNIPPKFALMLMSDIAKQTDYSDKYMDFYLFGNEISSLEHDGLVAFTKGLTKENANEYILNKFKAFRELLSGNYSDYINKAFCNNCKQIVIPKQVSKIRLKKPYLNKVLSCENCKSQNIDLFVSEIGKEKIIKHLKGK